MYTVISLNTGDKKKIATLPIKQDLCLNLDTFSCVRELLWLGEDLFNNAAILFSISKVYLQCVRSILHLAGYILDVYTKFNFFISSTWEMCHLNGHE